MNRSVAPVILFSGTLFFVLATKPTLAEEGNGHSLLVEQGESLASLPGLHSLSLGRIGVLAFSHDGKTLASGTEDGTVCLWDMKAGRPSRCFSKPEAVKGRTTALAFSPQDLWIAAGQVDGSVDLWAIDGTRSAPTCRLGPLPDTQKLGRAISSLVFTPDGSLLAVGTRNNSGRTCANAFETAGRSPPQDPVQPVEHTSLVGLPGSLFELAAFDQTGQLLAVATGTALGVWKVDTGAPQWLKHSLPSLIVSLAISPDGKMLATGLLNGGISLWEAGSGKERPFSSSYNRAVRAVAFSPDGTQLVARSEDHNVSLWDTKSGRNLRAFPRNAGIAALAFHPDGGLVASTSEDASITLYEVSTAHEVQSLRTNADWIRAIAFNPQGTQLATASDDQQVRIWKRQPGGQNQPEWRLGCSTTGLRGGIIRSLAFSPSPDNLVAIAMDSPIVRFLNPDTCSWADTLDPDPNPDWVRSVAFSPNGRKLASGTHDGDNSSCRAMATRCVPLRSKVRTGAYWRPPLSTRPCACGKAPREPLSAPSPSRPMASSP